MASIREPTTGEIESSMGQSPVTPEVHSEGSIAKAIEQQTAKLPSDLFLYLAASSVVTSLGLRIFGKKSASLFIGEWVAPILLLGIYNKIVKVAGSDRTEQSKSDSPVFH